MLIYNLDKSLLGVNRSVITYPHTEDTAGIRDSLGVGLWVSAAAADVEAHANHVQPQFLGPLQESATSFERRPKLHTEATHGLRVVSGDTQHQPENKASTQ